MEESVEAKNELILDWVKKHDLKEDEFWYIVGWFKDMSIMKHFVDAMYNIIKNDKYHFYDNKEDLLENAGEGNLEMDKFMWTLLLLSSLEDWIWNQA